MKIYFIVFILFLSNEVFTQSYLAFNSGITHTIFFSFDDKYDWAYFNPKSNFEFSFFYCPINNKRHTYVRYELDYKIKSFDLRSRTGGLGSSSTRDVSCDLGFFNLAVYGGYKTGSKHQLYINLGLYAGIMVNSKEAGTGSLYISESTGDYYSEFEIDGRADKDFGIPDLGCIAIIGFKKQINKRYGALLEFKNSLSLITVTNYDLPPFTRLADSYNLSVLAGIFYNLQK